MEVTQLAVHGVLDGPERRRHLDPQPWWQSAGMEILPGGLRGDREPGRDGQPEVGHLGEVRALATEKFLEVLVAFVEGVNKLSHGYLHRLRAGGSTPGVPLKAILPCAAGAARPRGGGKGEKDSIWIIIEEIIYTSGGHRGRKCDLALILRR